MPIPNGDREAQERMTRTKTTTRLYVTLEGRLEVIWI
jgi:hypothetical protein